jgi:hypothetical protein
VIFEKDWSLKTTTDPHETLLALCTSEPMAMTPSGEPLVHLHIDCKKRALARLEVQNLELIDTDRAIAFYAKPDEPRSSLFTQKVPRLRMFLR